VYETDTFGIIISDNLVPAITGYKNRMFVPLIRIEKLHDIFENVAILALFLAGTIDNRKYSSIEEVEYYYQSVLHFDNPHVSIATLIAPRTGKMRDMADNYAKKNDGIKVFYSDECSNKITGEYIIAIPYPEFVGSMPRRHDEYGLGIHLRYNVCVINA
jgi:hypothetical protein